MESSSRPPDERRRRRYGTLAILVGVCIIGLGVWAGFATGDHRQLPPIQFTALSLLLGTTLVVLGVHWRKST